MSRVASSPAGSRSRERLITGVALGFALVGFLAFVARPAVPVPVADVSGWMPDRVPAVNWDRLYLSRAAVAVLRPALLVLLVASPGGRRLLRRATGWMSGTVTGAAMAAVNVLVVVDLATLPIAWWGRLATEPATTWLADWVVTRAQTWALVGLLAGGFILALRRWPDGWRWRTVLACTALAALVPLSADLDPFAGPFTALPDGPVREAVETAQERAGIKSVPIRVGSGAAATELGAYVSGIGPSAVMVLSTPLVERFPPDRVAFVAMHEYAHREHLDVYRKVLGTVAGLVVSVWLLQRVLDSERVRRQVSTARAPAARRAIVALAVVAAVHAVATPVSNLASRQAEAAADRFALEATADPESAIAMQRFLLEQGASDPAPPTWYQAWLATYPTAAERIGLAVRYGQLHGIDVDL